MNQTTLKQLLDDVKSQTISVDDALLSLKNMSYIDIGHSKIDTQRALRTGFPEVIYCQNKTAQQISDIVKLMINRQSNVLATRLSPETWQLIKPKFKTAQYNELARVMRIQMRPNNIKDTAHITIVAAGTSDLPVVEEAYETATAFGYKAVKISDVGVAGIHRLVAKIPEIKRAAVVIVVAGMEGALPSVVAGLIDKPIIAVPTSVGYGASFNGLSALLTMLNSCAAGITVVNIDNGFGAAYAAVQILRLLANSCPE